MLFRITALYETEFTHHAIHPFEMHSSAGSHSFTKFRNYHPLPNLRTFSSLPERNLTVISSHSTSVASQTRSPLIDSVSMDLFILDCSHKWDPIPWPFQLASFTVCNASPGVCRVNTSFLLRTEKYAVTLDIPPRLLIYPSG